MKDLLRQISVALTILATIVVNVLANVLPINGQNTGAISDPLPGLFCSSRICIFHLGGNLHWFNCPCGISGITLPTGESSLAFHGLVDRAWGAGKHRLDLPVAL